MAASTSPMSKPLAADVAPTPGPRRPAPGSTSRSSCVPACRPPTFSGSRSPPASPRKTPSAPSPRFSPISAGPTTSFSDLVKFCGILTELNAEVTRVRHAVIGIGINVHQPRFPDDLRSFATSLFLETGRNWPRQDCSSPCCNRLEAELAALTAPADLRPPRKASVAVSSAAPPGFAASGCASMKAMDSPEPPKASTRAAFSWSARPRASAPFYPAASGKPADRNCEPGEASG